MSGAVCACIYVHVWGETIRKCRGPPPRAAPAPSPPPRCSKFCLAGLVQSCAVGTVCVRQAPCRAGPAFNPGAVAAASLEPPAEPAPGDRCSWADFVCTGKSSYCQAGVVQACAAGTKCNGYAPCS